MKKLLTLGLLLLTIGAAHAMNITVKGSIPSQTSPTFTGLTVTGVSTLGSDVYTVPLTDYSSTSTVIGYLATTESKLINYKKVGKTVFVYYIVQGISNSPNLSFTVPFNLTTLEVVNYTFGLGADNTGRLLNPTENQLIGGQNLVTVYKNIQESTWESTGEKDTAGQFVYETD